MSGLQRMPWIAVFSAGDERMIERKKKQKQFCSRIIKSDYYLVVSSMIPLISLVEHRYLVCKLFLWCKTLLLMPSSSVIDVQLGHTRRLHHEPSAADDQSQTFHWKYAAAQSRGQGVGTGKTKKRFVCFQSLGQFQSFWTYDENDLFDHWLTLYVHIKPQSCGPGLVPWPLMKCVY